MSKILVINDLHLGVERSGGTTPASAIDLRKYGHRMHTQLLELAGEGDTVLVNGDLTDTYSIALTDALEIYGAAARWLTDTTTRRKCLIWALGNHDLSKDSSKLGTVAFIGRLLEVQFPANFVMITKPSAFSKEDYVIPHVPNQEIFDLELSRVPDSTKRLYLHCNYDNVFAGQADHSLNLSRDQAKALVKRGMTLILGHEHQGRTLMNDKVIIVGNQFPSSVSDCLQHGDAQTDGRKYALVIDGEDMELVPTWSTNDNEGGYREVPWTDLDSVPENTGFLRVTGRATPEESAAVIKAIANLRQRSGAFVITNAVKVDGAASEEIAAQSLEDIRSVNVIELLLDTLDDDQKKVVQQFLNAA